MVEGIYSMEGGIKLLPGLMALKHSNILHSVKHDHTTTAVTVAMPGHHHG
jgi:hypothetical protein